MGEPKVDRELKKLLSRYSGFHVEHRRGGSAVVAATGDRIGIGTGTHVSTNTLREVEKFMRARAEPARVRAEQDARRRREHDGGHGDNGGGPTLASKQRRVSLKRLNQMRETWPKLLPGEQQTFVTEAITDLARTDPRWARARAEIGV